MPFAAQRVDSVVPGTQHLEPQRLTAALRHVIGQRHGVLLGLAAITNVQDGKRFRLDFNYRF